MNDKEYLKDRVNFLYYDEGMTQEEVAKNLKISRQTVNAILNSNKDHKVRKVKRKSNKTIYRKAQFHVNTSPTISIPKDILERVGIDNYNREVKINVEGQNIVIRKKRGNIDGE